MDSSSFDRLTRLFSASRSRRGLGGAALGSLAGLLGLGKAAATHCPAGKKHCGRRCIPKRNCCTNANCPPRSGKVCRQGRCQCPPARPKLCAGVCIAQTTCCGAECQPPPDCTSPEQCPQPPSSLLCARRTCENGRCGFGPRAANTSCRPVADFECDVEEFCDGSSLDCPPDQVRPPRPCRPGLCVQEGQSYQARQTAFCTGDDPVCPFPPLDPCGYYNCYADGFDVGCRERCDIDNHCHPNAYCFRAACVPKQFNGTACAAANECFSGFCVDETCCAAASCVAGQSCTSGTCQAT